MKTMLLIFLLPNSFSFNLKNEIKESSYKDECIYYRIIEKADQLVHDKQFKKARELFRRAVIFRPADIYPKVQLVLIDKQLSGE